LGLPLIQRIVEGLGGTIEVTSELGQGSRFIFRLPRSAEASTTNTSRRAR